MELPDWINRDSWEGFVEMRKRVKSPLTDRAMVITVRKLEQMRDEGYDPNAALDESTFRGWRGVFPQGEPKRKEWKSGSAQLSADDKDYYRKMGWLQ